MFPGNRAKVNGGGGNEVKGKKFIVLLAIFAVAALVIGGVALRMVA
jgi:hypothetical protein